MMPAPLRIALQRSGGPRMKELRVMSREEILPIYKDQALVRAPEGQVVLIDRCANRSELRVGPLPLG